MRLVFILIQVLIVSFPYGLGTANLIVFFKLSSFFFVCLFLKGKVGQRENDVIILISRKLKIVIKIFFPRENKESGKGHEGQ